LPPKIKLEGESISNEPQKRTSRLDILGSNNKQDMIEPKDSAIKTKNISVDPPIRRDTYHNTGFQSMSNSYNNTKYGFVNPINGLMHTDQANVS
jgi:hypothetical protein